MKYNVVVCGISTPVVCYLPKVEKPVRFWYPALNEVKRGYQIKISDAIRVDLFWYPAQNWVRRSEGSQRSCRRQGCYSHHPLQMQDLGSKDFHIGITFNPLALNFSKY